MIIDAGKNQGVKPGEAVVDARGMIGRIFLSGQYTSWIVLLTDLNSRIPVLIQPGNIQAIMAGDNTRSPTLGAIAQTVQLKAGDQVVTSGDGGLIPPGMPVGMLVPDGDGFRVALLADPSSIEDVRIVDFSRPQEQPPAPSPNDLPASAAGLAPEQPIASPPTTPMPQTAMPSSNARANAISPPPQAVGHVAPQTSNPPPMPSVDDNGTQ